jgi:conjugal transfer pilus assembly protein TraU
MNPEVVLFANPVAQGACAIDCKSAAVNFANDKMFWCAGCLGNAYPLSGHNADYVGGVQNSSLLTYRILAKMHRAGLARETSTSDGSYNGKLCRKPLCLNVKKSQYKLQLVYPKAASGSAACVPLGISDLIYSPGMEYPGGGQDWVYLIWRKKNCCML